MAGGRLSAAWQCRTGSIAPVGWPQAEPGKQGNPAREAGEGEIGAMAFPEDRGWCRAAGARRPHRNAVAVLYGYGLAAAKTARAGNDAPEPEPCTRLAPSKAGIFVGAGCRGRVLEWPGCERLTARDAARQIFACVPRGRGSVRSYLRRTGKLQSEYSTSQAIRVAGSARHEARACSSASLRL